MNYKKIKKCLLIILGILIVGIIISCLYYYFTKSKDNFVSPFKSPIKPGKLVEIPSIPQESNIEQYPGVEKLGGNGSTFIYMIKNFLTPQECQKIIKYSQGKDTLEPSKLSRTIDDEYYRDSETGYFQKNNSFHNEIENKICQALGIPRNMAEDSQIQYYKKGKQFKAHYDYFNYNHKEEFKNHMQGRGQRTWTFMIYLNEVQEGGSTEFPNQNRLNIFPEIGKAVVWYNLLENGEGNEYTLHSGTPVKQGKKYIITKWFRSMPQY